MREATKKELTKMNSLTRRWYDFDIVPIFLMPDGKIRAQSLNGAFGGCRGALEQLKMLTPLKPKAPG